MRVRLLRNWIRFDVTVAAGEEVDLPDGVGRALIADKKAVRVAANVEAATLAASEQTARTRRPEPRARSA